MNEPVDPQKDPVGGSNFVLPLAVIFATLCVWPYARWFAHPSLFDDDLLRVGSLRRSTLGESLFRPFNEHMAPLFEVVSRLAWIAAGRQVSTVALTYQVSCFLAFTLTTLLLASVIQRELRSRTVTLIGVAAFALSAVSAETVLWFSASSFEWSALAVLGAWYGVIRGQDASGRTSRVGWLAGSVLASLAAPAFSAIGILAGPIAAVRGLATVDRAKPVARWLVQSLAPLIGTAIYLLICHQFAYGQILSSSVRRNLDPIAALLATLLAPSGLLIPALVGQASLLRTVPGFVLAAASIAGLLACLGLAWRSRDRGLILGGLSLIVGGYLATYATRARPGDLSIFEIQRYHLFPQLGLVLLLASSVRPIVSRFDRSWFSSLAGAVALAGLLAVGQYPLMQAASDRQFRYPDQPRAIAATLRLEAACDELGVTQIQALNAIDPVQVPWFPKRGPFHPMLHLFGPGPVQTGCPEDRVRASLIARLTIEDREAIFGGLNATNYRLTEAQIAAETLAGSRLIPSERMVSPGPDSYRASGRGSMLEFELDPDDGPISGLILPGLRARNDVEIWWTDDPAVWTITRSVRWTPDPTGLAAIDVARLPHWRPNFVRRVRVYFREWGPVELGPPRFARGSEGRVLKQP